MSNNRISEDNFGWPFGWVKERRTNLWHMSYDPDAHTPCICGQSIAGSPTVYRRARIWEYPDVEMCDECIQQYLIEQARGHH